MLTHQNAHTSNHIDYHLNLGGGLHTHENLLNHHLSQIIDEYNWEFQISKVITRYICF